MDWTVEPAHYVQWNPSITDTIGDQRFVCCSEVSLTQGASGIFPVGVVLHNQAVEHNVAGFLELSFAIRWQGRLSRGQYYEYQVVNYSDGGQSC